MRAGALAVGWHDLVDAAVQRGHQPGRNIAFNTPARSSKQNRRASGVCVRPASSALAPVGPPGLSRRRCCGCAVAVWVEPRLPARLAGLAQGAGVCAVTAHGLADRRHAAAGPGWFSRVGAAGQVVAVGELIATRVRRAIGVAVPDLPDAGGPCASSRTRPTKCRPDASPNAGADRDQRALASAADLRYTFHLASVIQGVRSFPWLQPRSTPPQTAGGETGTEASPSRQARRRPNRRRRLPNASSGGRSCGRAARFPQS